MRAVCFDKTGTLTSGSAVVERLDVDPATDGDELRGRAAALASASSHILARAIAHHVAAASPACPVDMEVVSGRGLQARLPGQDELTYLGSIEYLQQLGLQLPPAMRQAVDACLAHNFGFSCIGWNGQVRGVFRFRERVRDEAAETIAQLRTLGLHVSVLTGDHQQRADELASRLGVEARGHLLPHDKLTSIGEIRQQYGRVAMVGDGVNDAPALAAADVGIALGCGADVSREAADICLLGNDLQMIPWAIQSARDTRRIVRQNLFWAFAYNLVGVTLAVMGRLNPIVAAIAMVGSSLLVVSNSLRLAQASPPSDTRVVQLSTAPTISQAS